MAHPVVVNVTTGYNAASATQSIHLPDNIQANDLVLVLIAVDAARSISFPAGWTQLYDRYRDVDIRHVAYYRVATGDIADFNVTLSASDEISFHAYRISGAISGELEYAYATGGTSSSDPPSLTPSWGSEDYLWIAATGIDGGRSISAWPTDYTDRTSQYGAAAGG